MVRKFKGKADTWQINCYYENVWISVSDNWIDSKRGSSNLAFAA